MTETALIRRLMLAAPKYGARLMRNNVGQGLMIQHPDPATRNALIQRCIAMAEAAGGSGYRVQFGLCEGSSDLIGFLPVDITPDLVGQRVAVFTAIEGKSATGRPTERQRAFLAMVEAHGGIAAVVREVSEICQVLRISKRPE